MIKNESFELYNSQKEWISSSEIKQYYKSPLHYKHSISNSNSEETVALSIGNAYHTLVLEPERFKEDFVVLDMADRPEPDKTMASKMNKAWKSKKEAEAETNGLTIIKREELDKIEAMRDVLMCSPEVKNILRGGKVEQSYYSEVEVEVDGEKKSTKIRARPDFENENLILDLKSCLDASPDGFSKAIRNYKYDISAVHYQEAVLAEKNIIKPFFWLAQEKEPPYAFAIYTLTNDLLRKAREDWNRLMGNHILCLESDFYPSYSIYGVHLKGFEYNGMIPIDTNWRCPTLSLINQYPDGLFDIKPKIIKGVSNDR